MRFKINAPNRTVSTEPLTPSSFAPFGTVIQNPANASFPTPMPSETANQGSATKYSDVTPLLSSYKLSTSKRPSRPKVSLFNCCPRTLVRNSHGDTVFPVDILERHPFTPQTFAPLGLAPDDRSTAYLVIVAPTLPPSRSAAMTASVLNKEPAYPLPERRPRPTLRQRLTRARPNLFTNDYAPSTTPLPSAIAVSTVKPRGPGPPDLANLRAFVVRGDQAVTYGVGTWHAPMVVLGQRPVDFLVMQFMNGVGAEDTQEIEVVGGELGVVLTDDTIASPLSKPDVTERARL